MIIYIFGLLWLPLQGPVTRHIRQVFYLLIFSSIFQIFDQQMFSFPPGGTPHDIGERVR